MMIDLNENNGTINSTNNGNVISNNNLNISQVNCGLRYEDVKEICLDLFKSNFITLKQEAYEMVEQRINTFINEYIERLKSEKIDNLSELRNPDMQYMLYECQKSYARYGDEDLLHKLLFLMVERIKANEKNMIQLNLNEAASVIPKMTSKQINLITLLYIIKYTLWMNIDSINLVGNIKRYWVPFIIEEEVKKSDYQYLEYLGCGNVLVGDKLEEILKKNYSNAFSGIDNIKEYIIELIPEMKQLFQLWNETDLFSCNLTTVGLTIGWSNIATKIGEKWDLNIWI